MVLVQPVQVVLEVAVMAAQVEAQEALVPQELQT
jgi:hypothetical protein